MRVMVLVKATEQSEAGEMPKEEMLAAMMNYNEELVKAGVMLAGDGLHRGVHLGLDRSSGVLYIFVIAGD